MSINNQVVSSQTAQPLNGGVILNLDAAYLDDAEANFHEEDAEANSHERAAEEKEANSINLTGFLQDYGDSLFAALNEQNQSIYSGQTHVKREAALDSLARQLFPAQREVVRAVAELLITRNQAAAIINAEMGTGKTIMAIAMAAVMHAEGFKRSLIICPPHLVYKWRREILKTIPEARVWILNGADTLRKLIMFRGMRKKPAQPEFFILGRVRMRLGFNWKPAYQKRKRYSIESIHDAIKQTMSKQVTTATELVCPHCYAAIGSAKKDEALLDESLVISILSKQRCVCSSCKNPLWTSCHKRSEDNNAEGRTLNAIQKLPSIGKKTAEKLLRIFGHEMLSSLLESNAQAFANLMDEEGNLIFSDAQSRRLERGLGKMEFSLGNGSYQATEFIKRYLPKNYFELMIVDEAHEYKNYGTAQGQSMAVLAGSVRKVLALTGTLMGGYSSDIFYLLWRLNPSMLLADGFAYNKAGSLGSAAMTFARHYGVIKETSRVRDSDDGSFISSKAKRANVIVSEAPGFSPLAIMRYILPITVFLKLKEIGHNVLPAYSEHFRNIKMSASQAEEYKEMSLQLNRQLLAALRKRDNSLTSTVINTLLAWPETCFREEVVIWKRYKSILCTLPALYGELEPTPKELDVLALAQSELAQSRRVLVYSVYSDTRDTTARLKALFKAEGINASVMKATVKADQREDWVAEQLDKGMQVLICNPELVKTGLDLLEFPTIYFMQTGYNVYTLMQAARRSWRIGQQQQVKVYFAGYEDTAQALCLKLMAKKISVTQSTSGDMPDNGLEILNQSEDSIEVELARQLFSSSKENNLI